jgi:uncharacterized phage protein (TIGR01671 family)
MADTIGKHQAFPIEGKHSIYMQQRIIKFRAWDTKTESFKPLEDDGDYYFRDDGDGLRLHDKHGECKNVILLQHTGLKDKHGKDIYEGDLLSSKPYIPRNDSERYISQVVFRQDLGRWNAEGVGQWEGELDHLYEALKPAHETEIIGNIFENPDLIPSTQNIKQ